MGIFAVVFLLVGILVGLVGGLGVAWYRTKRASSEVERAQEKASKIVEQAEAQRKEILFSAREEAHRIRDAAEKEARNIRNEATRLERRLELREEQVEKKLSDLERQFAELEQKSSELANKAAELEDMRRALSEARDEHMRKLEEISRMSRDEAKNTLLSMIQIELDQEVARKIRESELRVREESEKIARNIIAQAIQRLAADQAAEATVTVLPIPNEEIKGRIIGKEGRNIKALQSLTGVDIIVDDTPEAITISGYDPVRREIAKTVLNKLIVDGRIHPARIEETVERARQEVEQRIMEEGTQAIMELGLGKIPPEIVRLVGVLRFRTSYGQNVLYHSKEVARLAAMIGAELKADVQVLKEAGLFHDIGKAMDHEVEGGHAVIGADLLQRLGRPPAVVHAVRSHHYDEEPRTIEAFILMAADAISGSRPGARRDSLDAYIKRLEKLEDIAHSFKGVEAAYAIQAGREIRIIVRPEEVDDDEAQILAREIVKRIEGELTYPGQIRVIVVRETRAVEYAR